ncbi:MAG: prepilin-type N-terminal cleavage/methylation domain-containing protein [Gammaproteobacteria bacterium]|nr:prepilin-type N-terminal cleavage/methylation domain-containing protein [Gammaproteobacteria bacterium]
MKHSLGFSLLELIIAMSIGVMLLLAVTAISSQQIATYLKPKAQLELLDKASLLQEIAQHQLSKIGAFNPFDSNQLSFEQQANSRFTNAIILQGDLINAPELGTTDNEGKPNQLVFHKYDNSVCSGAKFKNTEFQTNPHKKYHAVEQYYIEHNTLKCRAFDGGYLLAIKANELSSNSVSLLNNIYDMQFTYLVLNNLTQWQWLTLNDYQAVRLNNVNDSESGQLKAIKVKVLLRSDVAFYHDNSRLLKSFGERNIILKNDGLYRAVEHIVPVLSGSE